MAKEVFEQKTPRPAPIAPHANGTAIAPRVPINKPAPRRSHVGLWLMLVVVLLVAAAAGVYFFLPNYLPSFLQKGQSTTTTANAGTGKRGGAGASDKIRVVPATATKGDIGVYLVGLGAVTPLNTDTIQSRVNGQLMKVDFTEGQMVKAGDELLEIDDRPYKAQLAQYVAQKEHDQALLDNANIDLQRYQTLWKQDSIPEQTLATQASLVKQDQGTVDSDQALIDATNLNITYCNITAPISGRVGLRLVDVGNYVQSTSSSGLLVITQIQPITVIFTIPEDSVPDVQPKLNAGQQLTVEAFDRSASPQDMASEKKKLATGTLLTSDNQIDPTTGTLKLKASFTNEDNALFPNQFVNTRLLVETKKDVVIIPVAAIQYGTQGTFVYLVDDSEPHAVTVSMKNVTVGTIDGDNAEIQSGLDEGDVVVIDGVDKLTNGSKVILSTGADSKKPAGDATAPAASTPGT
jgi:multidrug efflux system membrane fusion protein